MNLKMCTLHSKKVHSFLCWENVDANSICLNELSKDVTNDQENVWSITLKVHKMGQTKSSFEKSLDFIKSKELTLLQKDFISFKSKVSEFIDLC